MSTSSAPIARVWQPPDELRRALPREVTLSRAGKLVTAIAVALLLGAIVGDPWLYVASRRDQERFKRLESRSVYTQAEVVSIGPAHGKDRRRTLTYQYLFKGDAYTGQAEMRREEWKTLQPGTRIRVRFVPANPRINWVPGHEPQGVPPWAAILFPAAAVMTATVISYHLRKQRALLTNGRAALAQVTRRERTRKGDHRVHRVYYEFKILSGATRTGHCDVHKNPPEVGSTLTVLYDPDAPEKNARYPLSLVRAARQGV